MEKERQQIIYEAMKLFADKGLKFTMQDICNDLHIAKKTIYAYYPSKEEMLIGVMDYGFGEIQENKKKILESDMPLEDKIRKVMIAMPDQYSVFDFRELNELQSKYPKAYANLNEHLESNWEPVLTLLEEGKKQGVVRDINIPVLRIMITASFESFLSQKELEKYDISYNDALNAMMNIVMHGISRR